MSFVNWTQMHSVRPLLLASLAATLAACAAAPGTGGQPAAAPASMADGTGNFSTGRLVVHVTDQNGRPLDRANVDVTGEDSSFYRNTGVTSQDGRVSFSGVPQVVNVSVTHQGGSYSQNFLVPPTGVSEMRLIVQTFDTGEDPQQQQDSGDQGGAGGGGFGGFRR